MLSPKKKSTETREKKRAQDDNQPKGVHRIAKNSLAKKNLVFFHVGEPQFTLSYLIVKFQRTQEFSVFIQFPWDGFERLQNVSCCTFFMKILS